LVTKGYLDKKLDEKLDAFVTKEYLDEKLDEKLAAFASKEYLDLRFDEFEEKIDEKMRERQQHFCKQLIR